DFFWYEEKTKDGGGSKQCTNFAARHLRISPELIWSTLTYSLAREAVSREGLPPLVMMLKAIGVSVAELLSKWKIP
ncbi:MAG: hypothetical protein JST16_15790, partial [Bdellovibrionales bacterium]|nr:hypothetical protein [Bdellovibrionales bacterium]